MTVAGAPGDGPLDSLPPQARAKLADLVDRLRRDRHAPTSVADPDRAWRVHVADSLSGLVFAELAGAARIADVGAGAGFPGLALAVACPEAEVDLIESVSRKAEWIRRAVDEIGIDNARAVPVRAEEWARLPPPDGGRESYRAVTARAVGRLATLAELASPLLVEGGVLVAWKGRRDRGEEAELERALPRTAIAPVEVRAAGPYAGSRNRHLHLLRKVGPTPNDLPRRPGIAKKRPFGSE